MTVMEIIAALFPYRHDVNDVRIELVSIREGPTDITKIDRGLFGEIVLTIETSECDLLEID